MVHILGFTIANVVDVEGFCSSKYRAYANQAWRDLVTGANLCEGAAGNLVSASFPEVHDAMINGEPVDCRVPDDVIQVLIERRVVICQTFNAAVMMTRLASNATGSPEIDCSIEVRPRERIRRTLLEPNSDVDDVMMLQKTKQS